VRLYKIHRNFACFWPPNFFRGAPPEFLDLHYKIEPDSNGVAKFDGDRPRELGDLALKKRNIISPPVTTYGRPNKFISAHEEEDAGPQDAFIYWLYDTVTVK